MRKTASKDSKRSSNLLIHPKFQLTLIGYGLVIAFLSIGVFYFSFDGLFRKFHSVGVRAELSSSDPFFDFIRQQKLWMWDVFLSVSVALLAFIVTLGLWVSHRIAGPLVRLKVFLETYQSEKEFNELKFRKNDYFSDLADSLNKVLSRHIDQK